jgi:protein-S-isoprenylcysteine O-methyltransferase Ste14
MNIGSFDFAKPISHWFPKTLDSGSGTLSGIAAIVVNLFLIALFGVQHSVMARSEFKKKWTKIIPVAAERSTFVLFASLALIVLFYFWQPIGLVIWDLRGSPAGEVFWALSIVGWLLLLISTFLINHFELFGLWQVFRYATGKDIPYMISFKQPGFYKVVRHPIYFSFLIAFWFAPIMTAGHLLFASGMTGYIFIGIYHEEKDLIKAFGEQYLRYRKSVPKIIPLIRQNNKSRKERFSKEMEEG